MSIPLALCLRFFQGSTILMQITVAVERPHKYPQNMEIENYRKRLLETFVACIELKNDVAVIFYNISDKQKQKRVISLCSDMTRVVHHQGLEPWTP